MAGSGHALTLGAYFELWTYTKHKPRMRNTQRDATDSVCTAEDVVFPLETWAPQKLNKHYNHVNT